MIKTTSICICWLMAAMVSLAQGPAGEAELIKGLEMQWMTAVTKKDSAALERFLGKNFELARIGGSARTNIKRDRWIKNYLQMDWSRFAFRKMQIRIDGNVATVNAILSFRLSPYPFRLSSGVLDVWSKQDGTWRVEKRYVSEDNLSRYLLITIGIGVGLGGLLLYRWIRSLFNPVEIKSKPAAEER